MKVVISGYGTFLGVKDGLIKIKRGDEIRTVSPGNVDQLIVEGSSVSMSSAFLRLASENNIDVIVLNRNGTVAGKFSSFYRKANVSVRKEQYAAQRDERSLFLAKCFVRGKVMNQYYLAKSICKNRGRKDLIKMCYEIKRSVSKLDRCERQQNIINVEAQAAEVYWNVVSEFYEMSGRKKRYDSPDPFNMALNYGYAILMSVVSLAIDTTNLDPFAGFLHAENPRRPALVVDLMEEFRQPVVDRAIFKITPEVKDGFLTADCRKEIISEIFRRLETKVTFENRKLPIEYHIYLQARRLERFLLGKSSYTPFILR
ncbi:CRISPR-associated endonuclease Cas1 [Geoglobus acetivorans]|uniref:CRISPR-associated endonuclease Cas1 n=1 Tax=Geoglobus acetivorans TaxID=565033 RepID=A0ABZ3H0B4_GEOAI|nr:CRISPR-associated endonuclease Cas1 [Geoglobus acetivorans]